MSSGVRVIIQKAGGVSAITTEPMQAPPPKEGEVRIKVAYAGINFADLLMRLGFYQPRPPFPFTPGYEVSGVVDALGQAGERVLLRPYIQPQIGLAGFLVRPVTLETMPGQYRPNVALKIRRRLGSQLGGKQDE